MIGPNGILRTKARIFVTHGIHFLSKTDSVVMMRDGKIIEQGHFDSLMKRKSELFNLIKEFGQQESNNLIDDVTDEPEELTPLAFEADELHSDQRSEETVSPLRERRVSVPSIHRRSSLITVKSERKQGEEIGKDGLITKEESAKGRVAWDVYASYTKSCGFWTVTFWLITLVISQGIQVGKYMIKLFLFLCYLLRNCKFF